MPSRIYLMRHGEVLNGDKEHYNGHIDIDITLNGLQQMHRLADILAGKKISIVYSSDLLRTVRGAKIIADRVNAPVIPLKELRERSVGKWEGLTVEEIKDRYPAEYSAWQADLLNYRPQSGENVIDVQNRILPIFKRLVASSDASQEIAMMLHGGINRVILADILGIHPLNLFRIEQSFGALNIIDYREDGTPVVTLLNG